MEMCKEGYAYRFRVLKPALQKVWVGDSRTFQLVIWESWTGLKV